MKVLGLGGNLGDRKELLREGIRRLSKNGVTVCKVSDLYESDALLLPGSDPSWNLPFYNIDIEIKTELTPHQLLKVAKEIEKDLGREFGKRWSPRPIDIDIILWDDLELSDDLLTIPHKSALERPFVLLPLNDLFNKTQHIGYEKIAGWRKNAPLSTKSIGKLYPDYVGILNVTPDSFSDGGKYNTLDAALKHTEELIKAGASVIDLGAESTRPNSKEIDEETELERLKSVLPKIKELTRENGALLSVDTRHTAIVRYAIEQGVDWINDVSAATDKELLKIVAASNAKYVLMHSLTVPPSEKTIPEDKDVVKELLNWTEEKLSELDGVGLSKERVIFDPGLGFGKTPKQCMELISRAEELHVLGLPVLFGHSRKSFIKSYLANGEDIDDKTKELSKTLATKCVEYLRVHQI